MKFGDKMKIRKIEGIDKSKKLCLAEMAAIGQTIVALKEARAVSAAYQGPGEFRGRCADAIVALANTVLEDVESRYAPETRAFKVTFDVKRSGCHVMVVNAADEAEARQIALHRLEDTDDAILDQMKTEVVATDVVDAVEVSDGRA